MSEESDSGQIPEPEENNEMPTSIQTTNDKEKYEDISLPDNSNHKAVVEVHYKRYLFIIAFAVVVLIGLLFATNILSVAYILSHLQFTGTLSVVLVLPILVLFWLLETRFNS